MDTEVAHRHQALPHLRSPSSVGARTAPKVPVADHPRSRCLISIPLNSPGLQQPVHYTQPTQSIKGPFRTSSHPHDSRSYVAGHEHMLRRKTPNGTLAAGYDGRPCEWASRRPANKYLLMPASNTTGDTICQPHARNKEYDKHVVQRPPSSENHRGHHTQTDEKSYLAPGLDSVLYQGSPSYLPGPHAGGQQIPMVMQPMWPPCVGITSLNHPGPYWPNGASFVPYRPAPIRDPRFHTGLGEHVLHNRTPDQIYLSSMAHNVPPHPPSGLRLSPMSQGTALLHHVSALRVES